MYSFPIIIIIIIALMLPVDDDNVYFTEIQHVEYKNLYPYGSAKTA
jgi:hypothetical protein